MSIYTIKKGDHSSGFHFAPVFFTSGVEFAGYFDETCLYEGDHQGGLYFGKVNKFAGVGFSLNHHSNSARLGWYCKTEDFGKRLITLEAYYYQDGNPTYFGGTFGKVLPGQAFTCKITRDFITVKSIGIDKTIMFPKKMPKPFLSFKQYPYFGGSEVAPHDVSMFMEWL